MDCDGPAIATILNSLPALLAEAERANKEDAEYIQAAIGMGEESGYRDGVIKGLERARHYATTHDYADSVVRHIDQDLVRIRSGGAIETTGGTPGEKMGRFGHHPDPANDFCVEVEAIEGLIFNFNAGIDRNSANIGTRIARAMQFTVGADEIAVKAKARLREIERAFHETTGGTPDQSAAIDGIGKVGDLVWYRPDSDPGTKATLRAVYQDGDAEIEFDNGATATVKWQSLYPGPPPAPQDLPKGWLSESVIASRDMDRRWVQQWGVASLPADEVVRLLAMADAAFKMRRELQKVADAAPIGKLMPINAETVATLMRLANEAREALAELEKPNG
jgi:hypothetical protein